jgi:hypothetical protein
MFLLAIGLLIPLITIAHDSYNHFYHCVSSRGNHLPSSRPIVHEQMKALRESGLEAHAQEIHIGINGGKESEANAGGLLPPKAYVIHHGAECRNENLTLLELCKRANEIDGEAYMLSIHSKGASHPPGSSYGETVSKPWRLGMMEDLVFNWRKCVAALDKGYDIACSHWMWNMADGTQHIPAGGFLWVKASFVRKLPSIYLRARIKALELPHLKVDTSQRCFGAMVHDRM